MVVRSPKRQEVEKKKADRYEAEKRAERKEETQMKEAVTLSLLQFQIDEKQREGGVEEGSSSKS